MVDPNPLLSYGLPHPLRTRLPCPSRAFSRLSRSPRGGLLPGYVGQQEDQTEQSECAAQCEQDHRPKPELRESVDACVGRVVGIVQDADQVAFLETGRVGADVGADLVLLARCVLETKDWIVGGIAVVVHVLPEIDYGPFRRRG